MRRLIPIVLLFSAIIGRTQNISLENVLNIKLEKIGPIYQNKQVKGYFMFYQYERIDKETNEYLLKMLDENLQPIGEQHITGSRRMYIEDAAYDNLNILIKLVDPAACLIRYILFDDKANEVEKNDLIMDRKNFNVYHQMTRVGFLGDNKVQGLPGVGFVSISSNKPDKAGYTMEFISRQQGENKYWKFEGQDEGMHVHAAVLSGNKDQIFTLVLKRRNNMTNIIEVFFQAHNTQNGKRLFEVPLISGGTVMWPTNAFTEGENIILSGAVFTDTEKLMKAKSRGLGLVAYNNKGKEIKKRVITWEEADAKVKAGAEVKHPTSIYFHEVIRMGNGNFMFVGESYRRTAHASGIVSNVLGSSAWFAPMSDNFKVMIDDMVMLEITPDMVLKDVHLFKKATNNAGLPVSDFAGLALLGNLAKRMGAFDFLDTQTDPDNPNRFSVNYLDFDKIDEGNGAKTPYYGTIIYSDGKFSVAKIPLNSTKSGTRRVYPAKPGFAMVLYYYKKEKIIDLELIEVGR